ncbi:MAG: hypothetical protein LBL48_07315 [Azoarcus sp.]|jgi:hypothetical protein|nr:hypothetical protein [Azoarcus sp.]
MPFPRPHSFTREPVARVALLFFLNLCGIAALPAQAAETLFAITRNAHETYPKSVCANEFGRGYRVADWRDIEAHYKETGSLDKFFSRSGLKPGRTAQVMLDGEPRWRDDLERIFFIERHDGRKPGYFLAHAQINRHQLSLGSWTGARPVLCVRATPNKVPVAVLPKAKRVKPKTERQARANASGCESIMNEDLRNFCKRMSSFGASCGDIKNADLRNICLDNCNGVKNADMRNVCIGIGKSLAADCGGVKNADWRNFCIGIGRSLAADCGNVRDKDLRTSCREIRNHRQYEEQRERRGSGGFFW